MTQVVRISVLGGFRIETGGQAREERIPRKLAALVGILATAGVRGVARERLVALLWEDAEEEKGRHALAQSVYSFRRAVGIDEVITGTDRLCLNAELVGTDIADLRAAIAAGDTDAMLGHSGTLLDGMSVPGAGAFERWLEEERRDLQRTLGLALDRLAEATRDPTRVVELRRRRVLIDPLDATTAMSLMRALADAGDVPSAVQHARVYGELVRQELELDPDPRVAQLAADLRAAAPAPHVAPSGAAPAPADPVHPTWSPKIRLRTGLLHLRSRWRVLREGIPRGLVRRAMAVAASGVAVLLALAHYGSEHVVTPAPPPRVAVLPFATVGTTPELDFLRTGLVDLLGHAIAERDTLPMASADEVLARAPVAPAADSLRAVASSLGATRLVSGTLVGTPRRLVLRAHLLDLEARPLGTVTVSGTLDSLAPMVRRAATQLVATAHGAALSVGTRELTPRVLRAWLDGRAHYREGRWVDARRAFAAALGGDSTFDVAAVHLALAADWLDDAVTREQALAHLAGRVSALPEVERAIALALRPRHFPESPSAEEFFASWEDAARASGRAEWWVEVGRRYLADGNAAGMDDATARAARAFARAWAIDSSDAAVTAVLASAGGDGPSPDAPMVTRWREAIRNGNEESLARFRAALPAERDGDVRELTRALITDAAPGDEIERLIAHRMATALGSWGRRDAAHSAHALALDRGDGAALRTAVARIDQLASFGAGERLAILDAMYGEADTVGLGAVVTRVETRARMATADPDQRRAAVADLCVAGQWRAWRGERSPSGAMAILQGNTLGPGTVAGGVGGPACAALVAAIREGSSPRPLWVAAERLERMALAGPAAGDLRQYATLALARVRLAAGDYAAAWRLVQRRPAGRGWPRYLAAYDHLEGRIAEARADSAAARAALRRYVARRAGADGTFSAELMQARQQLERLGPES